MKKQKFAIILFSIVFLSGCGKIYKSFVYLDFFDSHQHQISYTVPSDNISGNYNGIFKKTPWFVHYPNEEEMISFIGHGNMTGYMYTYSFPDLGINFEFKDFAASYFNPNDKNFFEPKMYYSQNKIFYERDNNLSGPVLYIFSKNTGENFINTLKKNHSPLFKNGCLPTLWSGNLYGLSGTSDQYEVYDIERNGSESCFPGQFFIFNKKQSARYYLVTIADACAPSCNTFTKIEFF